MRARRADVQAFPRRNGLLHADQVSLAEIAETVGTPAYVYVKGYLAARFRALEAALAPRGADICYAVKANANLGVLRCFAELGAGFDIVSAGELERVLHAGGRADRVVFSGVGKRIDEIDLALKHGIRCFNVESAAELDRLAARARLLGRIAPVSIRVNPDVDAQTHPYISTGLKSNKFGVPREQALSLYQRAAGEPSVKLLGIDCHIGSQITEPTPLLESLDNLLALLDELRRRGIELEHIDLGGGLGVDYHNGGTDPDAGGFDAAAYGAALNRALAGRPQRLVLEPGRYLVANAGVLLTRVEYLKRDDSAGRGFAVVDAAMNDLIRPALYQAWHDVVPVQTPPPDGTEALWDVVGPVCESADFLARERPLALAGNDLLAVCSAGAYGMVQSSNYNSRCRPPEVMVDGDQVTVVRRRETLRDLLALELCDAHGAPLPLLPGDD